MILDDEDMQKYLDTLDERGVVKLLRTATGKGGIVLRNAMRPEVPVKKQASGGAHGEYMTRRGGVADYGTPGGMRASVSSRRIRGNDAIGVVVGPMGKRAFMRHWIAQGTKPHEIRPKDGSFLRLAFGFVKIVHHPGSKPNDYAGRAASSMGAALDKAEEYLFKEATK